MQLRTTDRGFPVLEHPEYGNPPNQMVRLVQQSSAIGEYEDSFERPGTSFLWVGGCHHLNRDEVGELITYLHRWLATGDLRPPTPSASVNTQKAGG